MNADDVIQYEVHIAEQQKQIAELMAQNAELMRLNCQLSEILRKAAMVVAGETLTERRWLPKGTPMGLLRKMTSMTTGGIVDFRSDKERIAKNTKATAKELKRARKASK